MSIFHLRNHSNYYKDFFTYPCLKISLKDLDGMENGSLVFLLVFQSFSNKSFENILSVFYSKKNSFQGLRIYQVLTCASNPSKILLLVQLLPFFLTIFLNFHFSQLKEPFMEVTFYLYGFLLISMHMHYILRAHSPQDEILLLFRVQSFGATSFDFIL